MQSNNTIVFDAQLMRQALTLMHRSEVFEIRLLHRYKNNVTASGVFEDADAAIAALQSFSPYRYDAADFNAYMTVQKLNQACDSMLQYNCFYENVGNVSDNMVDRYQYLFVDLDPDRVAKVSSSEDELKAACELAKQIIVFTRSCGLYDPAVAMSGNGYHLFYRIDVEADKDHAGAEFIKLILERLNDAFGTNTVHVDTGNFNPARICKLHGTRAMKGSNRPHRPWRLSKFVYFPDTWEKVNDDVTLDVLLDQCEIIAKKR